MSGSVSLVNGHIDPDKGRMTNKEIIKALECCIKAKTSADCEALKCPFYDNEIDICMYVNNEEVIYANALDLIKRQQAEIERLKEETKFTNDLRLEIFENKSAWERLARAEAIKEFAEKLKKQFKCGDDVSYDEWLVHYEVDNLVKEVVGK